MQIKEFLANLEKMSFSLSVQGGKLILKGDKNKLSPAEIEAIKSNNEVIDYIKSHKDELIDYISLFPGVAVAKNAKDIVSVYRLSGLQQGMLFYGLYNNFGSYIEQFGCDLIGANIQVLLASWAEVIKRHSILRSAFYYDSFSVPVQCVYREVTLPVEELDYRGMDKAAQQSALKKYEVADRAKGFDFKSPPLMRLGLIRLDEDRYRMLWTSHHLLFDGWSLPVLIEEFLNTYELLISGQALPVAAEDRYEDYIRYLERKDKNAEEQYWRGYLQGLTKGTLLPFVKTTAERTKGKGKYGMLSLRIDVATTARIQAFAQANRLTMNTLAQGIWAWLLHLYTKSSEIVYGVIVSGRPAELPGIEQRVGMYINTLPFKATFSDNQDLAGWLQTLQADQVASRQYQYTELQDVKEWTGIKGDLFDSVLVFENYPVNKLVASKKWSLRVENVEVAEHNNYPLSLVVGSSDEFSVSFSYNTELLELAYVKSIRDLFEQVLLQIADGSAGTLDNMQLLSALQQQTLLNEFNDTAADYPKDKSIVALFEEQVKKAPDSIAIIFGNDHLTYAELNVRSNQLAYYLQKKGVKNGTLVPVCIERSMVMMVGILGILKAGGAYVPLDPDYPAERISHMLEDTEATLVLSSKASSGKLSRSDASVIELDEQWDIIGTQSTGNPGVKTGPDDLAYVIYTSGSTGRPKGVMIEHKGVVSLVKEAGYVSLDESDTLLVTGSPSFDATTFEYWGMLLNGGKLIMSSLGDLLDSEKLKANIDKHKVNIMWFTSSWFNQLVDNNPAVFAGLRTVLAGGEKLSEQHVEKIKGQYPRLKLINGYGPTENTTFSLTYAIDKVRNPIPIGRPLNNRKAYVLNVKNGLVPVGVTGEVCLGGAGLSRGYLNSPELTAEKFINDPFSNEPGAKLYKTGDLGRWLPDGNIEYLGRIDDQVKIRGFRIELGEIENALNDSPGVQQAVVIAKEDKQGTKRLVAYIVSSGAFDKQKVQEYLGSKLPDYMMPALWVELDSLPLTSNGKVDKKALPDPVLTDMTVEYTAPANETETKLAEIWQELLDIERIGADDDFFELGGDSLLAIRLVSAVRKTFGSELPINDIFDYPTLSLMSGRLVQKPSGDVLSVIKAEMPRPEYVPLSFSQERLWFIHKLDGSVQYHIPAVLRLKGNLNFEALQKTIVGIVNRHEALRTVILEHEGKEYQHVMAPNNWHLGITEQLEYDKATVSAHISKLIHEPFNLSKDHMLRADLIKLSDDDHILVVTMHHIASDGWSRSILVNEVITLYKGYSENVETVLPKLAIQYADYAIWQRKQLPEEILEQKLDYWKTKLENVTILQLPQDYSRPATQSLRGAVFNFNIDKALLKRIQTLGHANGATLFMTLLSAFKVLLYRYSGQDDICVGTPIAGRQQQELEGLIGFFVNALALRSRVSGDMPFTTLLDEVKRTTLEAYTHQEVPFEKIVEAVVKVRDMSRNPLVQVVFILQNTPEVPELKLGELQLTAESQEHVTATYDIVVNVKETDSGLQGTVEYATDLYRKETIERMMDHYVNLLWSIVEAADMQIGELNMLSNLEERLLLRQFNDTAADYPKDKSIVDLFDEQVAKRPSSISVIFESQQLTYKELDERSNQLAHYLIKKGIKTESLVPVCIERSPEMIIAIMGILKAGGAYVPLDPQYPQERIDYMLEDTGATLVLGSRATREKLQECNVATIELDGDWELVEKEKCTDPGLVIAPEQLAYVIYTSGSTGRPKGVMIEHRGVVNLFYGQIKPLGLHPDIAVFQFASFSFDASCHEIFCTLLIGGQLIIADKTTQLEVSALVALLDEHKVELITLPPSYHSVIHDELTNLKTIISAGEPLTANQAVSIQQKGIKLINAYGPTENTVSAILSESPLLSDGKITIGRPIANVQIYILDEHHRLNPIGVPGELYIAGSQLARGYLNKAELTASRFVPNPFDAGNRMYRTGDVGRWLPDGNIEYLGRIQDDQVKIRGYRIELGEIEQAINKHTDIWQARVLAKETKNGKQLVAYYEKKKKIVLWPSTAEYLVDFVHDDLLYHAMADDKLRNEKYRNAFEKVVKGKVILEVGPGSEAILSRMCIEAGAKRVYCIEISDEPFKKSTALIRDLQLDDKIKIIHSDVTKIEQLPEPVDLCVSEIVGSIGGSEGAAKLINHVLSLVKEPGKMIPAKSITKIAAITLPSDDFDFSFSSTGAYYARQLFNRAGREFDFRICLQNFPRRHIISNEDVFEYLDYTQLNPLEESHEIFLEISAPGKLNGFAVWLVLYCDEEEVIDSMKDKHIWLPVYFPVFWEGIDVNKGDYIKCDVIRTLSENGLSPDFRLTGSLYRNGTVPLPFEYVSDHIINDFKGNGFYDKIFSGNELKVTKDINQTGLISYLKDKVPGYMIPSHFIPVDKFPVTINGKIDDRLLLDMEGSVSAGSTYVAPASETEKHLALIWQELLEIEAIGVTDDFFELGGHSLLAMRLIAAIRKELDIEISIRDLFIHPTIAGLSTHLEKQNKGSLLPAIVPSVRPKYIPLSFSQERLWFIDRLEGSTQYHIPATLRLKGNLDLEILERTIRRIIDRHEVLRTVIWEHEGRGYQRILPASNWRLGFTEQTGIDGSANYIGGLISKSFDLSVDYMLRADVIKRGNEDHILVLTMHHIASDGWSISILVKEVIALYKGYLAHVETDLPLLPVQYADYAIWQRKYIDGEVLENKLAYWKTKLEDTATLQLSADYGRPAILSSRGATRNFKIDQDLSTGLHALSNQHGATLYMTLLSAFNILLYRYSGQEDICVGTSVAGRDQQELEGLIGFFINSLALRSHVSGAMPFTEVLGEVKNTTLEAYAHQEVPFEKVVDAVVKIRDMSRNPLFQVMLVLQNTPEAPELKLGELSLSTESREHTTSQFDITFLLSETNNGIKGTVEYSTDLYKEETIVRMIGHYVNLLGSIVISPEEQAGQLSMLNTSEEATLLKTFNDTAAVSLKDKSVITLFEEQVSKTPDATAVIFGNEQLTYQELNERSNQVARYLQKQGVKAETLVPICVSRSLEMMTGILGIMKAGGAYVPIDPEYPQGRISYMLEDTGATIALCTKATAAKLVDKVKVIALDDQQLFEQESTGNIEAVIGASQLAYIIYTSGSTGKPKGVMIEHQNLVSYLCNNKTKYIDSAEGNKAGSFIHLSYTFDASLTGMFMPLIAGRYIVIGANDALEVFTDENLTKHAPYDFIKITPSHIGLLPTTFKTKDGSWLTKKLVLGGEALRLSQFEPLVKEGVDVEVINEYGPTEATVGCSTYRFNTLGAQTFSQNEVPIGKPIDNTHIYILNPDKALSPVGVTGELYIGGDGLARGYLNRDELTKERFINDPFSKEPGARLYRTGDIGRWLADGTIEYQGRIDDQVKIRGYRIELGEIESILNESEKVSQGVVLAKADKQGSKRLVAYVVPNGTFNKQAIQDYLSSKLPDYMVPALWVELTEIPLTSNGKADKRALPDPEIADLSAEYVAPRNETEEALVNIWQELLGVERVGIYDNFFELGGHSLLAMRVVSNIERDLLVSIPIKVLFRFTSISDLSKYIEIEAGSKFEEKNTGIFKVLDV